MDEPGERPDTHGPEAGYRRLYAACLVSMAVFAGAVTTLAVCLQQIGDDFGLSLASRGLLGSARMGALLAGLFVSGYLADILGKRPFLTAGMGLVAQGMAGLSVAGGFGGLAAASMVGGAGTGALEALVNPLVADLRPVATARHLNRVNGVYSLGLVVAALVAGELLHAGVSWQPTMLVWVAPAAVGAVLFAARRYPRPVSHADGSAARMAFLSRPLFWTLMAAMVIGGGCEAGMTFWGASFTQHELGASSRGGAWCLAFFGAFMAIGRLASGWLVSRMPALRLMTGSAAGCALATAGLWKVHTIAGAWALFGLGGLFVACFWPTLLAVAAEEVQAGSASMFALLAAAGIGGCAVIPWAIGALGDVGGLRSGTLLLPAAMALQVVIMLVAGRQAGASRRPRPAT
jgi:FHS family glucose/mannose:H+ symporter-like MFS transporter